jgi:hypothetical protein
MSSKIPLPNCISCPALDLFRKYKYPDEYAIKAFENQDVKKVLEKISGVKIEHVPTITTFQSAPSGGVPETTGGEAK